MTAFMPVHMQPAYAQVPGMHDPAPVRRDPGCSLLLELFKAPDFPGVITDSLDFS